MAGAQWSDLVPSRLRPGNRPAWLESLLTPSEWGSGGAIPDWGGGVDLRTDEPVAPVPLAPAKPIGVETIPLRPGVAPAKVDDSAGWAAQNKDILDKAERGDFNSQPIPANTTPTSFGMTPQDRALFQRTIGVMPGTNNIGVTQPNLSRLTLQDVMGAASSAAGSGTISQDMNTGRVVHQTAPDYSNANIMSGLLSQQNQSELERLSLADRLRLGLGKLGIEQQAENRQGKMADWTMAGARLWDPIYKDLVARNATMEEIKNARELFDRTQQPYGAEPGGYGLVPGNYKSPPGISDPELPLEMRDIINKSPDATQGFNQLFAKHRSYMEKNQEATRRALEGRWKDALKDRATSGWGAKALYGLGAINPLAENNWWTDQGRANLRNRAKMPLSEALGTGGDVTSEQNAFIRALYGQ